MIRGTTPTLKFILPFNTDVLDKMYVTIAQNNEVLIDKPIEECECTGNEVTVKLTQEETLKLKDVEREYGNTYAEIQIRVRTKEGEALASDIKTRKIHRILKEGVI